MGRPPCCDKMGVKKGPWTPEEDIMLVSYVQEHGPGNWRAVPTSTGLRRCSKSCRLRWTNYLRPGIRRGDFTDDEEKMIIQLQALLGNKWAAIASYLPERTDNDIKNYWNTHLKKKLRKLQAGSDHFRCKDEGLSSSSHSISRGQWERRLQTDIHMAKQALTDALSLDEKPSFLVPESKPSDSNGYYPCTSKTTQAASYPTYASSTENIARLLKGWTKNAPTKPVQANSSSTQHSFNNNAMTDCTSSEGTNTPTAESNINSGIDLSEAFESLFGFESFDSSNSDFEASLVQGENKPNLGSQVPITMLDWLLDEGAVLGKEDLTNFSFDENPDLF
ncbi:hypothetical protein RJ640_025687 [Escallonia rubra]|uniref:Uncharacterized protein n=1 Tax=Escallonia rubra TaxID=112253 RepID=A0AA88UUW6_9ASTE|nr:hypothetical protein RJ640_025687 [Escallonia rubra]